MKKITGILIIFALVVGLFTVDTLDIFSSKADANELIEEENILTVNGSGTIKVKPDIAYITLGVENFDADAQLAQSKNTELMKKVISELKKGGIEEKDIKTVSYSIYKTYLYEPQMAGYDKEQRKEGYQARNIVEVTVRDIDKVGKIIDLSSKAGANNVQSMRFGVVNEEKYYNDALKAAMSNAKGKADAILETFGAKASKPYSIIENSYSSPVMYREAAKFAAMDESVVPVEVGELDVTAQVMVKYKY